MGLVAFTEIGSVLMMRSSSNRLSGSAMNDIGVLRNAAIVFDEQIRWVGSMDDYVAGRTAGQWSNVSEISLKGHCVMPGFVDSHTHIVFAGSRANEYGRRLQGVSYQQIASEGGGILSTMRAVRDSSVEELADMGIRYALSAMKYGTTTIEVKSGYGLSVASELAQLRAIRLVREQVPMRVMSTFLGAHDIPPEYRDNRAGYIDVLCEEMLPIIAEEGLADFCDVFTDTGYYTIAETEYILGKAADYGLRSKVHADELSYVGAAECAVRIGAISADHLLCISEQGMKNMASSVTVGTLLPGTAYNLRLPYAPARAMIEAGMTVALATDCNPGSCLSENMQMMISLACTNMRMTVEEALAASTINGAAALGLTDKGQLSPGKDADMIIMSNEEYANIAYHFGVNHIEQVWIKGKKQ